MIAGRKFYDQSINDLIKQYHDLKKVSTGQGDDYTPGCLLDYDGCKDSYGLTAVVLSKQKALDANPRAIQQIASQGNAGGDDVTKVILNTILKKSKETVLGFYKGTAKVL